MFKLSDIKSWFVSHKITSEFINFIDDILIESIEHDTRRLKKQSLYVAIKGLNYDGHLFIKEAVKKGAVACIVQKHIPEVQVPQIVVKDTVIAYGDLAKYWRDKIKYPIIAVTGSNGKTTTKELIKHILSYRYKTVFNEGNLNNLIGLPYSLLKFPLDADFGILEMGMNNLGEIAALAEIAKPNAGLITNIGRAHIGILGSIQNILKAKLELFDNVINSKGLIVLNLSDAVLKEWWNLHSSQCNCKYIFFDDKQPALNMNIPNIHTENIKAAVLIAQYYGISINDAVNSLNNFSPPSLRSNIVNKDGKTFYMDCYNANPDSMLYSLHNAVNEKKYKRHIAVLGDMLELGENSHDMHVQIGAAVAQSAYDAFFAIGDYSLSYAEGFLKMQPEPEKIYTYKKSEIDNLINDINAFIKKNDLVFVKGSRGMQLERILK